MQVGGPLVTSSLPVGKWQRLACSMSGALWTAGTELMPKNSPLGPTCVGGSCPEHIPTCSHSVTQQGFGGHKQWWGRQGSCGVEQGHGQAGMCPLSLGPVHGSMSMTCHPTDMSLGVQRGCPPRTLTPGQAPGWICGSCRHPSPPICVGLTWHQALTQVPARHGAPLSSQQGQ